MTSLVVDVPAMYADHHVVEVRRILSEISGVGTITASSAFRVLEVEYDSDKTSEDAVMEALHGAGYIGELPIPSESGEPAVGSESVTFFRHTAAVETAGNTVSFGQDITPAGRPLWPCPGMGPAPKMDE